MIKGTVYISGPMRGLPLFNFPAFDAARDDLLKQGWQFVVSPADMDRDIGFDPENLTVPPDYDWTDLDVCGFSLADAVRRDVKALSSSNAIYLLEGWENSAGAKGEKGVAEWLGLEVLYQKKEPVLDLLQDEDILEEAYRITGGERNQNYGPPDQDFRRTVAMWNELFSPFIGSDEYGPKLKLPPRMVASAMIALKLSRECHRPKRDNTVGMAGYARCLSICQEAEEKEG